MFLVFASLAKAQIAANNDSVVSLSDVTVRSYESNRKLLQTSAGISLVTSRDMQRFSGNSLVPVINTLPGIRMEERSPGSYRFVIRGSLLRSPFGVRNVKFYWNDIPFTDAGGNTYLQLFSPGSINNIEIIKGPSGSLYGANTGGAVLMYDQNKSGTFSVQPLQHLQLSLSGGSYGALNEAATYRFSSANWNIQLNQSHQQSDGYRDNSSMRRDVINLNAIKNIGKANTLRLVALYADLFYKTPGGLTLSQMNANPQASRPRAGSIGSAVEQKAAINNKTFFAAVQLNTSLGGRWTNTTSVFTSFTRFVNPSFTTFEARDEANIGIRTSFAVNGKIIKLPYHFVTGAELQYSPADIANYNNNTGVRGAVQSHDKVNALQHFYFAQLDADLSKALSFTAAVSLNSYTYKYGRLSATPYAGLTSDEFAAQWLPRFSLLYKITKQFSAYFTTSKGYSAPTVAEVRSSDQNFNGDLDAESGWNYELGVRGNVFNGRLYFDVNAYSYQLKNAIVRRLNNSGAEYFINSGGTDQKGLEILLSANIIQRSSTFIRNLKLWGSASQSDFSFEHYTVVNKDYSGNNLTGVPKSILTAGTDIIFGKGFYTNIVYTYTHRLPLTDANDVYAPAYRLLGAKLGYRHQFNKISLEFFAGADNLLDEQYSLGYDINAAGSRFYNPAARMNFFGGIVIGTR